jgi:hypothetical protein
MVQQLKLEHQAIQVPFAFAKLAAVIFLSGLFNALEYAIA